MAITQGNQIASDQLANYSGSLAGTTAGSVAYSQINIGGLKVMILYLMVMRMTPQQTRQ
jgi:hypothetical protein